MLNPSFYLPWQKDAAIQIYRFFNGKTAPSGLQLQPCHAAGFVEQADAESSFKADVFGDQGAAYGLFQFHEDRLFAATKALNLPHGHLTIAQQCEMAWWDLTHPELIHLNQILKAKSAYDAGSLACKLWERAGAPGQPAKRGQGAEAWLAWLKEQSARTA